MLSLVYAAALFQRLAFQGVGPLLAEELALDAQTLADLGASFFWMYFALMIPSGLLVDAWGARRTGVIAALLSGLGCAMFALAWSPRELMVARVVISAGGAFTFVCMMRFIVASFPEHKTAVSGRALFVGNLGAMAAGAPLALTLLHFSWRDVWMFLAAGWFVLAPALWWAMPADRPGQASPRTVSGVLLQTARVLGSVHTWLAILVLGGLAGSYWTFANLVALRVLAWAHVPKVEGGLAISILVGGYASGSLVWGWLGDRCRREPLIALACVLVSAAWLAMTWSDALSFPQLAGLFLLAGFSAGAFGLVYSVLTDRHCAAHSGTVIATINCGIPLGAAMTQAAAGRLADAAGMLPIVVAGAIAVFAAIILWAACGGYLNLHPAPRRRAALPQGALTQVQVTNSESDSVGRRALE